MTADFTIDPLAPTDDRKGFVRGEAALDRYLVERASQDVKRRISNCFVVRDGFGALAGFYTLAAATIPLGELPSDLTDRLTPICRPADGIGGRSRLAGASSLFPASGWA